MTNESTMNASRMFWDGWHKRCDAWRASCPEGAAILIAEGLEFEMTGGGCSAFTLSDPVPSAWTLITHEDGSDVPDTHTEAVQIGAHNEDGGSIGVMHDDGLKGAAAIARRLAVILPHLPEQARQNEVFESVESAERQALARAFSLQLLVDIGAAAMVDVITANKAEAREGVCHSHDFCDANMTMHAAFVHVMGRGPAMIDGEADEAAQEADSALWEAAWSIAKASGFAEALKGATEGEADAAPAVPAKQSFPIDIRVCMTAYIEAASEDEARAIAADFFGTERGPECIDIGKRDIAIDDGDGPSVRLSPAITAYGRWTS